MNSHVPMICSLGIDVKNLAPEDGSHMADFIEALYNFKFVRGGNYGPIKIQVALYYQDPDEAREERSYVDISDNKP